MGLETFLGGMETSIGETGYRWSRTLKPSLVEWKQKAKKFAKDFKITLKPSLVEWKRLPQGSIVR
mgnify:CR=1 FL=1